MIKVKNRNYYVNENQLKLETLRKDDNGKCVVTDICNNKLEIDETTYRSLGGK